MMHVASLLRSSAWYTDYATLIIRLRQHHIQLTCSLAVIQSMRPSAIFAKNLKRIFSVPIGNARGFLTRFAGRLLCYQGVNVVSSSTCMVTSWERSTLFKSRVFVYHFDVWVVLRYNCASDRRYRILLWRWMICFGQLLLLCLCWLCCSISLYVKWILCLISSIRHIL